LECGENRRLLLSSFSRQEGAAMTPDPLDGAFLAAVLAEPLADTPRLVYADWLEERGDARAEFLRAECQFLKRSPPDPSLRPRLEELARTLDPDWIALVRRLPLPDAIETDLTELESLLPGMNYVVGFSIHRVPLVPGGTLTQYVGQALGAKVVVASVSAVTGAELLAEVERCLKYPGDEGHGPDASTLKSVAFHQLVEHVLDYLRKLTAEATELATSWILANHPFPGVMWEFDYVLLMRQYAVVFWGSSSD
jgi:uncharacterized protein (TIGR02996 family)